MWSCINFKGSTAQLMSSTENAKHDFIKPRYQKRHQDCYVTALTGDHHPTKTDYRGALELIGELGKTDKEKRSDEIKEELREILEEMRIELIRMRKDVFKVINANNRALYGVLRKGYSSYDRDLYIRTLMAFSDIIIQLQRLKQQDETASLIDSITEDEEARIDLISTGLYENLSIRKITVIIHPHSGLYGDLEALKLLKKGKCLRLPDLTYYKDLRSGSQKSILAFD